MTYATVGSLVALLTTGMALGQPAGGQKVGSPYFVIDSLRGTLARDHSSRLVHYRGKRNRSYVAYLDHYHDVMVTFYDHDDREWQRPVRVDCAPIRDGHAAPAIFVDSGGFVHTFSARGPIRHCRSREPEDISQWEPTQLVGPQTKPLTYTYPVECPEGGLLLFYRLGGAGGNSPLAVSRSDDRGRTWAPPRILVDYGINQQAGTVKINDVAYDAKTKRVHLALRERDNSQGKPRWYAHYCEYEPSSDRVFGLNGKSLGKTASRETLIESGSRLPAAADLALWDGRPYLLMDAQPPSLGVVKDGRLARWPLPTLKGANHLVMYLAGEGDWRIYGYRPCDVTLPYPTSGDLAVWRSTDAGRTWDQGSVLVRSVNMTHGMVGLNLVRQAPTMGKAYGGNGPLLLLQEAFSASYGRELRGPDGSSFCDMQLRFNKRLYALDGDYHFVTRSTPFRFTGYWDKRKGPVAGQAPGPRATFQLR